MNFRTTLILIGLLALVAGILVYRGIAPPAASPGGGQGGTAGQTILNMREPDLRGFTISSQDKGQVGVVLVDRMGWMITQPADAVADRAATESYLRTILALRPIGEVSPAMQAAFTPATTITLALLQGRTGEIAISKPSPVGETVLRYTVDSRVRWFLVDRGTLEALTKGPTDFRETRLVTVKPEDIGLITLAYDDRWVRLTRDPDGWGIDSGTGAPPPLAPEIPRGSVRADDRSVNDLLAMLTSLRLTELLNNAGDAAFARPQLIVSYTQFGATTQPLAGIPGQRVIRIGRFEDARRERVVTASDNPPLVGYLPAALLQSLRKSPLDLRDRQVLRLKPDEVASLRLTVAGFSPVELTRQADGWVIKSGGSDGAEVDTASLQQVLEELVSLRATRFIDPAEVSSDATSTRLEVVTAGDPVVVLIGKDVLKVGDVALESPTDLWQLTQSRLLKPRAEPTPAPATQPAP